MALQLDGSTQYLDRTSAILTGLPMTFACWFNSTTIAADQSLITIGRDSGTALYTLRLSGAQTGDPVRAFVANDAAQTAFASTSTGYSADTWQHGCAVFTSSSSRTAYLNGGSKVTNTTTRAVQSDLNRTTLGGRYSGGVVGGFFSGQMAHAGIWNVALTDDEVASLAAGAPPTIIRPGNLVFYAPLDAADWQEWLGAPLTPTGSPTLSASPRVYLPNGSWYAPKLAAAGNIAGAAAGAASTTATAAAYGNISGSAAGAATTTGTLTAGAADISGSAAGAASTTATIATLGNVSGSAAGVATTSATLYGFTITEPADSGRCNVAASTSRIESGNLVIELASRTSTDYESGSTSGDVRVQMLYARLSGLLGTSARIRIKYPSSGAGTGWYANDRGMYRNGGTDFTGWTYAPNNTGGASADKTFWLNSAWAVDSIDVGFNLPFPVQEVYDWVAALAATAYVVEPPSSVGGGAYYYAELDESLFSDDRTGAPIANGTVLRQPCIWLKDDATAAPAGRDKAWVVLLAGVHAGERAAAHALRHAVNWWLSNSSARARLNLAIYPLLNASGCYVSRRRGTSQTTAIGGTTNGARGTATVGDDLNREFPNTGSAAWSIENTNTRAAFATDDIVAKLIASFGALIDWHTDGIGGDPAIFVYTGTADADDDREAAWVTASDPYITGTPTQLLTGANSTNAWARNQGLTFAATIEFGYNTTDLIAWTQECGEGFMRGLVDTFDAGNIGTYPIAGSAAAAASTSGTIAAFANLSGSAASSATTTGTLTTGAADMVGTSAGAASTTATVSAFGNVDGSAAGSATVSATVSALANASGSAAASATTTGAVSVFANLLASAAGIATTTATATAIASLSGSAAGIASTTATLTAGAGDIIGSATGSATATATITAIASLSGLASGGATSTGALSANDNMAGSAAGVGSASATIAALASLSGASAGASTTVATLTFVGGGDLIDYPAPPSNFPSRPHDGFAARAPKAFTSRTAR